MARLPAPGGRPTASAGQRHETVIVGGGIAGLACARRLCDANRGFLLITKDVGGRIRPSRDGSMNLGALYVRADYRNVNRFVEPGPALGDLEIRVHDTMGHVARWARRDLRRAAETARLLRLLAGFRRRYAAFQRDCAVIQQAEAIRSRPWLWGLYREPALHFVRRHRLEGITSHVLGPVVRATGFLPLDRLTALQVLIAALPAIVPAHEYTLRFDPLLNGFTESILIDSVESITRTGNLHRIRTRSGTVLQADHVVVAAPVDVSKRLLGLGTVKGPVEAHMFAVRGEVRSPWAGPALNVFSDDHPLYALVDRGEGTALVAAAHDRPDFGRYFTAWQVVDEQHWDPAFNLVGDALLDNEPAPGLYLAGDHNVCNLEDAFLTGLYAANRIVAAAG